MKKKWLKGLTVLAASVCLTGCGNAIPEMNEQQHDLIVEYAANELLKYDTNHQSKLTVLELEQQATEEEGTEPEEALEAENVQEEAQSKEKVPEEPMENEGEGAAAEDVTIVDNTGENQLQTVSSIEEFLALEGVQITYSGYETDSTYPSTEAEDELFFFMNATEGKQLLVLKFKMDNVSGEELAFDMSKEQMRYKIIIDGVEKNALTTMLLNDMAYYQGTLAEGESTELVLVCEIPTEQADTIGTLELKMKSVDNTATISLN